MGRPKLPVDLELLKTGVDTQTPVSKLQGVEKQKRHEEREADRRERQKKKEVERELRRKERVQEL